MSTPQKSGYLLLFHGIDWYRDLAPEEAQRIMTDWYAWFDRLSQEGRLISGQPLKNEGKVVTAEKGKPVTVADGPFAESKEAIGGYFFLMVENEEEAVEIAKGCPALGRGITVEVRAIAAMCPVGETAGLATRQPYAVAGA
jgi:hypothetical protein